MNVEAAISDGPQLVKYDTNKTETIFLKVPKPYQRRKIVLSAQKRQPFGRPVFLSHQLSKEEAERENLAIIRRRKLLQEGAIPRSLRVRNGVLYLHDGNKWKIEGKNGNRSGTKPT